MRALKIVAQRIHALKDAAGAAVFRDLCYALEKGEPFQLTRLNDLSTEDFKVALQLVEQWRLDQWIPGRSVDRFLADITRKSIHIS